MKKIYLLVLFLIGFAQLQSQTGVIQGRIMESGSDSDYTAIGANIIVLDTAENIIAGGVTDFHGCFEINPVPIGEWTIEISYIGFETKVVNNVATFVDIPTEIEAKLVPSNEIIWCCRCCGCFSSCSIPTYFEPFEEDQLTIEFPIFPNPTSGSFSIELTDSVEQVSIFDLQGKLMAIEKPSLAESMSFDLSAWEVGTYVVHIQKPYETVIKKVVLQN